MGEEGGGTSYETTCSSDIPAPPLRAFILCSCSSLQRYIISYALMSEGGFGGGFIY